MQFLGMRSRGEENQQEGTAKDDYCRIKSAAAAVASERGGGIGFALRPSVVVRRQHPGAESRGEGGRTGRDLRPHRTDSWRQDCSIRTRRFACACCIVGKPQAIDRTWWSERLTRALETRRGLFDEQTTGFRWINGGERWLAGPGAGSLRPDAGAETLHCSLAAAIGGNRRVNYRALASGNASSSGSAVTSKSVPAPIREGGWSSLRATRCDGPVTFMETGLRFEADVLHGTKDGVFLDQRENGASGALARGRAVLNAFSFSGRLFALRGARWGPLGNRTRP